MQDKTISNKSSSSRRNFLGTAALTGLTIAGLPKLADASGRAVFNIVNVPDDGDFGGIPGRSKDLKILNYALALETLEADLYRQALNIASGRPLTTPLDPSGAGYALAVSSGGLSPDMASVGFEYLVQFAAVEAAHRDFLIGAITASGGTPITPNPAGYQAPFGTDLQQILELIRDVEETGVRAYLGAVEFIENKQLRQTAGTIYSTEARHSAVLNWILGLPIGPSRERYDSVAVFDEHGDNNFEHWQTPDQILRTVKPFFA